MTPGFAKSRHELPWLCYPKEDTVRIINAHNGGGSGPASPRVGFNFRSTLGYVTDGVGETFISPSVLFSGGLGYGWSGSGMSSRNRSLAVGTRLAGDVYGNSHSFVITLPSTGTYRIWCGFYDASYDLDADWDMKDNATVFQSYSGKIGLSSGVLDASNVLLTPTAWNALDGGNYLDHTFASTTFEIATTSTKGNAIAHLAYQKL